MLAKTAEPQVSEQPPKTVAQPSSLSSFEWQGIPIDVLRTFNVDLGTIPTKDLQQIKDITEWAKSKVGVEGTIGDMLAKVSEVRQKLGSPAMNEKSYSKVWEYVKLQRVADEAVKRQQALFAPRLI